MEVKDCACYGVCPWLRTGHMSLGHSATDDASSVYSRVNGCKKAEEDVRVKTSNHRHVIEGSPKEELVHLASDTNEKVSAGDRDLVRTYPRRWLMLILFSLFSLTNAYQWIHLNIIANVMLRYYNASLPSDALSKATAVDWLSMVYFLSYLIFIPLGMFILDSRGLRVNNVFGCVVNALGAWLKCLAVWPPRFPLLMAAQSLCGVAQIFLVSLPPRLAAVWFGPNEVSTATAIGVFGNQLGVAVGFLVPPNLVPNSPDLSDVGADLDIMFFTGAAFCTLLLLLMLLMFQSAPPHPPSQAQLLMMRSRPQEGYHQSILRLCKSPNFLLMMISYGLNTGSYYAIGTLLNSMVLHYFPGEEIAVGNIGLTIVLTGIGGSIIAGFWLDRSKYFKSTSVLIFLLSALGMVAFTFTLDQGHLWIVFLTSGVLGFFMTGYLPVGYEFAAEITYPEPEGTSSGLLTASAMFFGIVMTLGMRAMMNQVSILAANLFVSCVLLVGTVMTALIKARYYRQEAEKKILTVSFDVQAPEEEA